MSFGYHPRTIRGDLGLGLEWLSASSIRVKVFEEGTHTVATTVRMEREGLRWRVVDVEIPDLGLDD